MGGCEGESDLPGRNAPTGCPVGWNAEQWTRMQACHRCHHSLMSFLLAAWSFLAGRRTLVSDDADDDEQASMSVVASSKRPLTWHQVPWTAALLPSISNVGGGLVVPSSSSLLHTAPPPSLLSTKPWTQNTTNTQQFQFHIYTHTKKPLASKQGKVLKLLKCHQTWQQKQLFEKAQLQKQNPNAKTPWELKRYKRSRPIHLIFFTHLGSYLAWACVA